MDVAFHSRPPCPPSHTAPCPRTMLPHHFCPQVVAVILAVLFVVLLVVVVAVRCVRRRRLRRERQGLQLDGDHFSRLQ